MCIRDRYKLCTSTIQTKKTGSVKKEKKKKRKKKKRKEKEKKRKKNIGELRVSVDRLQRRKKFGLKSYWVIQPGGEHTAPVS